MATTQRKPARAPRKAARGRQKAHRTGPTKPNRFDDIARQVNAEQAAKDRAAGRDDLIPTLVKPAGQAKAKRAPARPTKAARSARPTKVKPDKVPSITVGHLWGDKKPDWLYRCTLVTRYEVRPDGTVWSTLHQVLGPDGNVLEDFWKLPLDYRTQQEVQGNGRKVSLRNRTIAGLQAWLIRKGLTPPEDITK